MTIKETLARISYGFRKRGSAWGRAHLRDLFRPSAWRPAGNQSRQPFSPDFGVTMMQGGKTMQPASAAVDQATDLASSVLLTMRQLGVVALPRNYEIFYEALSGSSPELSLEVVSLSKRPTQDELDRIGRKYFAGNHTSGIVEHARETLARELEEVASILRNERNHVEKYGRMLDQTAEGLNGRSLVSKDLLQKIVEVMSVATTSTIDHGKQVASVLSDKSNELESVKSKLEEYKRLANTDPLTQIWNRRAFDREIAGIYNSNRGILFKALILVDIDRFKGINDRFGHPVGDKVLQSVADILRSSVREDMFVARTGGEEFALIVEGASEEATFEIADRIRLLIEQTPFVNSQTSAHYGSVTVSMGICMASEAEGPEDLYSKCDQALYRSKATGRNRATRFSALPERAGKNWMLYKKD
jgi:diguanylate cyclase